MQKKDTDFMHKKHRQIVQGACRIFFKQGFHQTTTRQIAEACKMSKGQLYHYISSKDDILNLIREHVQELWQARFAASDIKGIADPFEKILAALRMTIRFNLDNRKMILFLYTHGFYEDEKQHDMFMRPLYQVSVKFWEGLLKAYGRDRPLADDIPMSARFIVHNMLYFVLNNVDGSRENREMFINTMLELILRGLGLSQEGIQNPKKPAGLKSTG